jgi:hypothetical protein
VRVAVIGSRDGIPPRAVKSYLGCLPEGTDLISGGARGVDTWVEEFIGKAGKGLSLQIFHPDFEKYGSPRALFARNLQIVDRAEWVTAFWNGSSRGTKHVLAAAKKAGLPVQLWLDGEWYYNLKCFDIFPELREYD